MSHREMTTIVVAESGSRDDIMRQAEKEPDVIAIPPWTGDIDGTIEVLDKTSLIASDKTHWNKIGNKSGFDNPMLRVIGTTDGYVPWRLQNISMYGTGFMNKHPDIGVLVLGMVNLDIDNVYTVRFGRGGIVCRGDGRNLGLPGAAAGRIVNCTARNMGHAGDGRRQLGYGIEYIGYNDKRTRKLAVLNCEGHDCRHFYTQGNHANGEVAWCDVYNQPRDSHAIDAHGATKHWASSERLIVHHNNLTSGTSYGGVIIRGGEAEIHNNQCNMTVQEPYLATNERSNQSDTSPVSPPAEIWAWDNYYKGERVNASATHGGIVHDERPT